MISRGFDWLFGLGEHITQIPMWPCVYSKLTDHSIIVETDVQCAKTFPYLATRRKSEMGTRSMDRQNCPLLILYKTYTNPISNSVTNPI
jgi:hypothetical protein